MLNICIQNLGMYNEGILCFTWLTLPATEDEIEEALNKIRICNGDNIYTDEFGQPYEEIHIPDWECDIPGVEYGEWNSIEYYNEIAEEYENLKTWEQKWLEAYTEAVGGTFENNIDEYQNNSYFYEGMSIDDVVREMLEQRVDKNHMWLIDYVDFEYYARGLNLTEVTGGIIETW